MGMTQFEIDLSELAGGRKVELSCTAGDLSRYFREELFVPPAEYAA